MPVMELSRMMTVEFVWLYAIFARPVMPECMNVESPITATVFFSASAPRALLNPWRELMEAPMHSVVSIAQSGGVAPNV